MLSLPSDCHTAKGPRHLIVNVLLWSIGDLVPEDLIMTDPDPAEATDTADGKATTYTPVVWHWFYLKEIDKTKRIWKPFSMLDSEALEEVHQARN